MTQTAQTKRDAAYDAEVAALDAITPETNPGRDASNFRAIIAARKAVDVAEQTLREAVAVARDEDDSWTIIGAALDTTRQAASQRFGSDLVPVTDDVRERIKVLAQEAAASPKRLLPARVSKMAVLRPGKKSAAEIAVNERSGARKITSTRKPNHKK